MSTLSPFVPLGCVSDTQVDEASALVESRVRGLVRSALDLYLADVITDALCDVQKLWGLGFISQDPELNQPPRPA